MRALSNYYGRSSTYESVISKFHQGVYWADSGGLDELFTETENEFDLIFFWGYRQYLD